MPFRSRSQERGAFSGALGPEMKAKAQEWADETPNQKALPERVKKPTGVRASKGYKGVMHALKRRG
jgi:hypothetical protein